MGAVAVYMRTVRSPPPLFGLNDVIHNTVGGAKLPDLLLHRILKYALLVLNQAALLLIIVDALLISPVATPPVPPGELAGSTAVSTCIATFFLCSGALGAGAKAAAAMADHRDETAAAQDAEDNLESDDEGRAWRGHAGSFMLRLFAMMR
jgi:hypothetical protein